MIYQEHLNSNGHFPVGQCSARPLKFTLALLMLIGLGWFEV
jgi:hypothetical protein